MTNRDYKANQEAAKDANARRQARIDHAWGHPDPVSANRDVYRKEYVRQEVISGSWLDLKSKGTGTSTDSTIDTSHESSVGIHTPSDESMLPTIIFFSAFIVVFPIALFMSLQILSSGTYGNNSSTGVLLVFSLVVSFFVSLSVASIVTLTRNIIFPVIIWPIFMVIQAYSAASSVLDFYDNWFYYNENHYDWLKRSAIISWDAFWIALRPGGWAFVGWYITLVAALWLLVLIVLRFKRQPQAPGAQQSSTR